MKSTHLKGSVRARAKECSDSWELLRPDRKAKDQGADFDYASQPFMIQSRIYDKSTVNVLQLDIPKGKGKDWWTRGELRGLCNPEGNERKRYRPLFITDNFYVKSDGFSLEAVAATVPHWNPTRRFISQHREELLETSNESQLITS